MSKPKAKAKAKATNKLPTGRGSSEQLAQLGDQVVRVTTELLLTEPTAELLRSALILLREFGVTQPAEPGDTPRPLAEQTEPGVTDAELDRLHGAATAAALALLDKSPSAATLGAAGAMLRLNAPKVGRGYAQGVDRLLDEMPDFDAM